VIVIGLTGSIGMGKTTAAQAFRALGVPVFDADAVVHRLLARGGAAVAAVATAFPGVDRAGAIDRAALGARIFADVAQVKALERIVHPLVRREERRFLAAARRTRAPLVVLDIPLLFETGRRSCDATLVVSAPAFVQRARVMQRPGMTDDKLAGILRRQVPDPIKRRLADFVIPTGAGKRLSLRRIRAIVTMLRARPGANKRKHARGRPRH
jgi:dephospho-CoA kinase